MAERERGRAERSGRCVWRELPEPLRRRCRGAMAGWGSFYRGEGLEEEEEQQIEEEGAEAVGKGLPPPHRGQLGACCRLSRLHGRRGRC